MIARGIRAVYALRTGAVFEPRRKIDYSCVVRSYHHVDDARMNHRDEPETCSFRNPLGSLPAAPPLALAALAAFALTFAPPRALGQSNPPGSVSSVSLTHADGTVTVDWPAVAGAAKYHVTHTTDGDTAAITWTPYAGDDFQYYRVIGCDDTEIHRYYCIIATARFSRAHPL